MKYIFNTNAILQKGKNRFLNVFLFKVLREVLREVQTSMVPRTMLKEWATTTFPSATDYWTFRKMFTLQLALAGFAEYVLHLSRLNPDTMYIHQVKSTCTTSMGTDKFCMKH